MTGGDHEKQTKFKENIVDLLAMPEAAAIEFEPAKLDNLRILDLNKIYNQIQD